MNNPSVIQSIVVLKDCTKLPRENLLGKPRKRIYCRYFSEKVIFQKPSGIMVLASVCRQYVSIRKKLTFTDLRLLF